jgi:hypothetical protein
MILAALAAEKHLTENSLAPEYLQNLLKFYP